MPPRATHQAVGALTCGVLAHVGREEGRLVQQVNTPRADGFLDLVRRSRDGFRAFAASVDLIGIEHLLKARPNDLQQGFGESLEFYPGGREYRVCFAGDSLFAVLELEPQEENEATLWAAFCGHLYALSAMMNAMDRGIGNPGLRVIIAAGPLVQLREPDKWKSFRFKDQTVNWFTLTGASVALSKAWAAERAGSGGGFLPGYCWHEKPGAPGTFMGTALYEIDLHYAMMPQLYPAFYRSMVEGADRESALPSGEEGASPSGVSAPPKPQSQSHP